MADSTSVGTVQLDVAINPQSLNKEISKLGNNFNSSFKNIFSEIMGQADNFVKSSVGKIGSSFKNFTKAGTGSSQKVAQLSQETSKLGSKLAPLTAKSRELSGTIMQSGTQAQSTGGKLSKMGTAIQKMISPTLGLTKAKKLFSNETQKAGNATSIFSNKLGHTARTLVRNFIVNKLIIKTLQSMKNYMGLALKTNQQFAQSLNIIRTNLLVAFQPIYEFILPALNALMKGVATVTTYIASAISALFGKTYKQSFSAAKSLNKSIKSMNGAGKAIKGTGKAAKKAGKEVKGMLMPFDEINQLDRDKGKDTPIPDGGDVGGGSPGFEMTMPDLATIDTSGIEKFKEIMASIFEPFKSAWENEGQATIDSAKYALSGVWGLIKEIGKSWLEVWTNGTGQLILETFLRILQNILGTVGDIAQSFTNAWTEAGLGTSIIQHIHNIILHILTLAERLTGAFREVWGEVGDELATIFLQTLDNILGVLDLLGEKLIWVWDNGGEHLFQGFVKLGVKILELALTILNEFVLPFVEWFIELISPAVATVMDKVGSLFDTISGLIDWLMGDGYPVLETIVTVLGSMATIFGIVKKATTLFGLTMGGLKSPISIATLAIGAVIAVGILLYKHWDEISAWLKETWQGIKDKAEEIWNGIKNFFVNTWNSIKNTAKSIWESIKNHIINPIKQAGKKLKGTWNSIKKYILNKWNEIKQGILNKKNALVNAIMKPFHMAKDKIHGVIKNAKDWGKNLIGNFIDGIHAMIGKVRDAASSVASTVSDFLGFHSPSKKGPGKDADKWMPNLMDMLTDGIQGHIREVSAAVNVTAGSIQQGMQPDNVFDGLKSSVVDGVVSAMNATSGNSEDHVIKVYSVLDGKVVGESVANWNNGIVNQGLPAPIKI